MTVNIDMGREPAAGSGAGFRCRRLEAAGFGAGLEFETDDIGAIVDCCNRHASQIADAERHQRLLWRTTLMSNPGDYYRGERKTWLARGGADRCGG